MWNKTEAADEFAHLTAAFYMNSQDLIDVRFDPLPQDPALRRLCRWVNQFNEACKKLTIKETAQYRAWFCAFILEEARIIERRGEYGLIADMATYLHQARSLFGEMLGWDLANAVGDLWENLLSQVMALLGDGTKALVGVRDGIPAWRSVEIHDQRTELSKYKVSTFMASYGYIDHVGVKDAWMVADFREFDLTTYLSAKRDREYLEVTRSLMESAYYQQQYIINPDGVYVKLTNARNITGLYLKVHGRPGTGLVDVLVRAETTRGAVFFVLTEEALMERFYGMARFWPGSYVGSLAAQVYYDLVTAETVSGSNRMLTHGVSGPGVASWTAIPRKIGSVVRELRTESTERVATEPHRVTGHMRNTRMSDTHREELKKFERETGLEILRLIPEGYTFVRPHISPRASAESVSELPRFIRYRIQQHLEEVLSERKLEPATIAI